VAARPARARPRRGHDRPAAAAARHHGRARERSRSGWTVTAGQPAHQPGHHADQPPSNCLRRGLSVRRRRPDARCPGRPARLRSGGTPDRHHHRRRRSGRMSARILVIDDEAAIRSAMRMILEYEGHEVLEAASGPEGLQVAQTESPDLVFLDIKMPGMDGLEVLTRLRAMSETLPVVIISAHGSAASALEAGRLGAYRFIEKPLSKDYVLDAVREGLELASLRHENRALRSALEVRHEIVGDSPAIRTVLDQVRRAAPSSATVL